MCGENFPERQKSHSRRGSPPRVRGKPPVRVAKSAKFRITPACAGKTYRIQFRQSPCWDHPRVCGENFGFSTMYFLMPGSPPRVRGKLFELLSDKVLDGITPACAGKTRAWHTGRVTKRDHPRVCGENKAPTSNAAIGKGSPPRVRGKRLSVHISLPFYGITPACAGKTSWHRKSTHLRRDHPRVCGENAPASIAFSILSGSPPRVRGKPV